jgi:hypothetical protein
MSGQWPDDQRYFIDLVFLDDPDDTNTPAAEEHPVRRCFAEVSRQEQLAIPVTGLARSPGHQDAVRQVVAEQKRGLVLRLAGEDFEDPDELESQIEAALDFFEVQREDVDLILDAGSVAGTPAGVVAQLHRARIELIASLDTWSSLTVAGSAFPLSLAPLQRDQWNQVDRADWRGWSQMIVGPRRPARLPSFSDYALASPELPPEGRATILAQLRYATSNNWLVWKGRNVFTDPGGFNQFYGICANLIQRPEYRGTDFSWGDAEIQQKATNVGGPGNAEMWRRIGTSHHIETVLEQIANLP